MVLQPSAVHKDSQASAPRALSLLSPRAARGVQGSLCAELQLQLMDTISRQDRPQLPATAQTSGPHRSPVWLHRQYRSITHLHCSAWALLRWRLCCVLSLAGVHSPQDECSLPTLVCFRAHLCVCPFPVPHVLCNEGENSSTATGEIGHCQRSQLLRWWVRIPDKLCTAELTNKRTGSFCPELREGQGAAAIREPERFLEEERGAQVKW